MICLILFQIMIISRNFETRQGFEQRIWNWFHLPINFSPGRGLHEFFLVAEFTRSRIKLTHESVGTILLSFFRGHASLLNVAMIARNLFKFSVSSMDVGFAIYNGGNIFSQLFNLGFLLWGPDGPKSKQAANSPRRKRRVGP